MTVRVIAAVMAVSLPCAFLASAQQKYVIVTTAGNGTAGYTGDGGPATSAQLSIEPVTGVNASGLAVDGAGNLYVADIGNSVVRKIAPDGTITTVAGSGTSGNANGSLGGPATSFALPYVGALTVDAAGNLYLGYIANTSLTDRYPEVLKVTPQGIITTTDPNGVWRNPFFGSIPAVGLALDAAGNFYVTDQFDSVIRKLAPDGTVTTVAGDGVLGYSGDGGPAANAQLYFPAGVALDAAGDLYIADELNSRIRRVTPDGTITTAAQVEYPLDVKVDSAGNLYVAQYYSMVWMLPAGGSGVTVAGTGIVGFAGDGGPATNADLSYPGALALDAAGDVYIADYGNNVIRELLVPGTTTSPILSVTKAHQGQPVAGQTAATYSIVVSNTAGAGPTSGMVTVTDSLPRGLVLQTMGGDGWSCPSNTCSRGDPLGGGTSYPTITVVANIVLGAPLVEVNQVFVSGGGPYGAAGADTLTLPAASGASLPALQITTVAGGGLPPLPAPAVSTPIGASPYVAVDASQNLYFSSQNCVWKIDTSGTLTLAAGASAKGGYSGDGGQAANAVFNSPTGLVVDGSGNLYIADTLNNVVRMVSPNGTITTIAGTGLAGYAGDGGPATSAQLNLPEGLVLDSAGNLYIGDTANNIVRMVAPTGTITTFAGNGGAGYSGDGGPAVNAQLSSPVGLAVDAAGNLYIADAGNNLVRMVSPGGVITTVAGTGAIIFGNSADQGNGGPATGAPLNGPASVAVDGAGNLYIVESGNNIVRVVAPSGIINIFAGTGQAGYSGDQGVAVKAEMNGPTGVALDTLGDLYIADRGNSRIRKVMPGGTITTVAGNGQTYLGDGGPASDAQLNTPRALAVDPTGNLYISDLLNDRIRKVTPDGTITTVAGSGVSGYSGDGGLATAAKLNGAKGLAADSAGNLYIADTGNNVIREVSPSGIITTIAGSGATGYSGDGGPAKGAKLYGPRGMVIDGTGNLYFADGNNNVVRKLAPGGIITTVAGNGAPGYSGDGGPAAKSTLNYPTALALDGTGNLYIADSDNSVVREVLTNGIITTVAGTPGRSGYLGDGGPALSATFSGLYGISVDAVGNLYIADTNNNVIRVITPSGAVATVAGNGVGGYLGDGGPAPNAELNNPYSVVASTAGSLYVADTLNNVVRLLSPDSSSAPVSSATARQRAVADGKTTPNCSKDIKQSGSSQLLAQLAGNGNLGPVGIRPEWTRSADWGCSAAPQAGAIR